MTSKLYNVLHGDKSIEYGTYLLVGLIEKLIPILNSYNKHNLHPHYKFIIFLNISDCVRFVHNLKWTHNRRLSFS